jgi:hypothetical protein
MNARHALSLAMIAALVPALAHAEGYKQEISRKNRGFIIFKLDRSSSMAKKFGRVKGITKSEALHTLTNDALQNLMRMSNDGEGTRDYMDVAVISIGGHNEAKVLLAPTPIGQLQNKLKRVATGKSGSKMGIWVDHEEPGAAEGTTPLKQGLELAHDLAKDWIGKNPHAFPPTVISVTDGMAFEEHRGQGYKQDDSIVEAAAHQLKSLKTSDGNVLLLMAHITDDENAQEVKFPTHDKGLDEHGRLMFKISSELPESMRRAANLPAGTKGMMSQTDLKGLIEMFNLGTQSTIPTGLTAVAHGD